MRKTIAILSLFLISAAQAQVIGLPGLGSIGHRGLTVSPQQGPVGSALLLVNATDNLLLANGSNLCLVSSSSC
jgi:hypothetical protein